MSFAYGAVEDRERRAFTAAIGLGETFFAVILSNDWGGATKSIANSITQQEEMK